ncbi:hypothetical protein [Halochromatium roseum]|uniref:hypothetical protein n=1 Tax=Halochromatium roseum TaxID=391920 RepID=UPI0019124B1E|nr:hypothetical protein [Halochromatium roseum]MBK5941824.1 hypothetical protein [Halochromatium roseum]
MNPLRVDDCYARLFPLERNLADCRRDLRRQTGRHAPGIGEAGRTAHALERSIAAACHGWDFLRTAPLSVRDPALPKAAASDYFGRFREVVSDPLNAYIPRHARAGLVEDGLVYLHNGHRVPVAGKYAYYDDFSNLLVINRGVHEPLEEYCFQEILKRLPSRPFMLELGALWAHYSMWCKQQRPNAEACMVEPEPDNLESGRLNFARHGYSGRFIQAKVGPDDFKVDAYMAESGWDKLDILHADIQGAELAMLDDARQALERRQVDYLFLSTHSQQLHHQCAERLTKLGYVVVVSADFDNQTTSYDGFLLAVSPLLAPPGSAAP